MICFEIIWSWCYGALKGVNADPPYLKCKKNKHSRKIQRFWGSERAITGTFHHNHHVCASLLLPQRVHQRNINLWWNPRYNKTFAHSPYSQNCSQCSCRRDSPLFNPCSGGNDINEWFYLKFLNSSSFTENIFREKASQVRRGVIRLFN